MLDVNELATADEDHINKTNRSKTYHMLNITSPHLNNMLPQSHKFFI